MWLKDHPDVSGLFNVGTGNCYSFRQLAEATFHALGIEPNITYIDMPEHLKEKYQYYTKAEISKLRQAGFNDRFANVHEGAKDYVLNYLGKNYEVY